MKESERKKLQKDYESIANAYLAEFCKKQELEFDGWVGDIVGGVAMFGDFFFSFPDIVWDINSNQPPHLIIAWYDDNLRIIEKSINYFSYTKGLRISQLEP
jgi:hypothetical protein